MSLFGRLRGRQQHAGPRRKSGWDEAWRSYPGAVDDAPAQWSVDVGAVDAAPVAELPIRMDVEAPYPAGPDGLPIDGAGVAAVEEAVRTTAHRLGGVYVGRLASRGVCRFTAHLPARTDNPTGSGEPAGAGGPVAVEGVPGARTRTEFDPHWAYVRDVLAPDERQHRLLQDLAVVEALSQHGDTLGTPRDVAHLALFAEAAAAELAADELRADGYVATVELDDEGGFMLSATRGDPVTPPQIHDVTWAVKELVDRHGGSYEGWSCAPVPGAPA